LVKLLLLCLNRGKDEVAGKLVSPTIQKACEDACLGQEGPNEPISYKKVEHVFFEVAIPWMAELYASAMNCVHYSHDRSNYEALQMAFHNSEVNRFMAFGIAGLSVVADSLSALKHDEVCPIRNEEGLTICFKRMHPERDIPMFGNNEDAVDDIAVRLTRRFHDELSKQKLYRDAVPTLSILTITSNLVYGKATGASPDGRTKDQPFAPGANPMHGRDKSGVVASLASVAKIPYSACLDGVSNTLSLLPTGLGFKEEERPNNLVSLLDGDFKLHGHHLNINVLRPEVLEDADKHPDKYPNLTIRVSGYCVKFTKLSPEQRKEVMRRTMFGSGVAGFTKKELKDDAPVKHVGVEDVLGSVYAMETFSTTDGPGIRVNVFLQGCTKRCTFCCNPEMLRIITDPELHPEFAMTDSEIAAKLTYYKAFLKPNNGGVTVSGGEPLLQPHFVASVFRKAQGMGLTTCLDTAVHGMEEDWILVLKNTNYVMLCLKGMDNKVAAKIAKVSATTMQRSKEFALFVRDNYPSIKLSLRWVLIQGQTDTQDELDKLIDFAMNLAPVFTLVELIPYHVLGKQKYESLEMDYCLEDMPSYKRDDAKTFQQRLERAGIETVLAMV